MANHLAIATATEALRLRLTAAIKPELSGVDVVARRPETTDGTASSLVTVFLYRVTRNPGLSNADLPTRGTDGKDIRQRPTAALDLHYLLSFSGDEQQLVPQRMLGMSVASLHSRPQLGRAELTAATQGEQWLAESNLADEIESVKFTMAGLSLDDLSKIWSVFFQVPYRLSAGFEASMVLIESDVNTRVPLPVQRRGIEALPIRQPVIEHVGAAGESSGALVGGDTLQLEILGRHLRGASTSIRFDGGEPHQPVTPITDRRIVVPGATLAAGMHGVQVVHEILLGDPPLPHRAVESDVVAFIIRPSITPTLVPDSGPNPDPAKDIIEVDFAPPVRPAQRVKLLINEYADPLPADRELHFYQLEPATRPATPAPTLRFPRGPVNSGTYLVRAQVDGAESLLDLHLDADPRQPPTPRMVVP